MANDAASQRPATLARGQVQLRLLLALGALLAVAILVFLRKPDALLAARFSAEDAVIFFNEDRRYGLAALFKTYAGYHHLLPRIVALLVGRADLVLIPLLYACAAWLAFIGAAAVALCAKINLALPVRIALALSVAFVPHGGEAWLILTNIQWILAPALLLLLLQKPPTTGWSQALVLVVIALLGLTGPFLALFLPVLLVQTVVERNFSRYRLLLLAVAFVFAYLQLRGLAGRDSAKIAAPLAWIARKFATNFIGTLFYGPPLLVRPKTNFWAYSIIFLFVLIAMATSAARRGVPLVGYLLLGAIICLLAGYYTVRDSPDMITPFMGANRYTLPPNLLLMWSMIIFGFAGVSSIGARGLATVMLLSILITSLMHFQFNLPPSEWATYVARYHDDPQVLIPIDPPSWVFRIEPRQQ